VEGLSSLYVELDSICKCVTSRIVDLILLGAYITVLQTISTLQFVKIKASMDKLLSLIWCIFCKNWKL
jgi:hypothetical protein